MINKFTFLLLCFFSLSINADTIGKYVGIAKSIPTARMKADPKAQAWAHSARTVLDVTEETLTQTINSIQDMTKSQNNSIFCLPNTKNIDVAMIHQILEQQVTHLAESNSNKTISAVVVEQLAATFPCNNKNKQIQSANNSMFNNKNYQIQSSRH